MNCEVCQFQNPKGSVTAAIIRNNELLFLKRAEEPFIDKWDLPGGYMNKNEDPETAIIRELKEELNITAKVYPITILPGTGYWKEQSFPIISHFYLADIGEQEIKLNEENSDFAWLPLQDLKWQEIAWDSNRDFCEILKKKLVFDLKRVQELATQLDSTAVVDEQRLYRAFLQGVCSRIYDEGKLVGMGWAFIRETMLRKQAVVEDMIIDESKRGKGYGKRLLDDLIGLLREQNVEVVELTTNPKRVAAHGLYLSSGFKIHETDHMLLNL